MRACVLLFVLPLLLLLLLVVLVLVVVLLVVMPGLLDSVESVAYSSAENATRSKRFLDYQYLVFPEGSNVQLVYCMTIGSFSRPVGKYTFGATAGIAYQLPSELIDPESYTRPELYHRRSRRDLYRQLEVMFKTHGQDDCVLKALCRAGRRNRAKPTGAKGSFLAEILHAVFTFPAAPVLRGQVGERYDDAYDEDDCDERFDVSCPQLLF